MRKQNVKSKPTLAESAREATKQLQRIKITGFDRQVTKALQHVKVTGEPKAASPETVERLCELCRQRPVDGNRAICAGCGLYICPDCFATHRNVHYQPEHSISGEVLSKHSNWHSPVREQDAAAQQTRFVFPEK